MSDDDITLDSFGEPPPTAPPGHLSDDGRPALQIDTEGDTIRTLTKAVNDGWLPDVYVTNGHLTRLTRISGDVSLAGHKPEDLPPLPVSSNPLTPDGFASLLAHHMYVHRVKRNRSGDTYEEETIPPARSLAAVLTQRYWDNVRPLHGIVGSPVLRPDGTLLQKPGYDAATGLYYAPKVGIPLIPHRPTVDEVTASRDFVLRCFLGDFPWVGPADRANYLGLLISHILRPYLRCLMPLGVISAPSQSSGKTLLAEGIGYLFGYKPQAWTHSQSELRKAITSLLTGPHAVFVFDNLKEGAVIDSPILALLLTSHVWSDRLLGSNDTFETPNDRLWLATGNNIRLGGDMSTRTVLVRLDSKMAHPELRTEFAIPNLDNWIGQPANRAILLRHLLILVMDWISNGADRASITMRQFSPWASAVGGFCRYHGVDGFLTNVESVRDLDDEDAQWGAVLGRWAEIFGTERRTTADLRKSADLDMTNGYDRWGGDFVTDHDGKVPNSKSLGRLLLGQLGRFHGEHRLTSTMDPHKKVRLWWVETSQ